MLKYWLILAMMCAQIVGAQTGLFEQINRANDLVNSDAGSASELIKEALKTSLESDNVRAQAYCYNTLGAINYKLQSYNESARNYLKSINLFSKFEGEEGRYNSYKYIGQAYEAAGQVSNARQYYLVFLDMTAKDSDDRMTVLSNLGQLEFKEGHYPSAKSYFEMAEKVAKKRKDDVGRAQMENWLGLVEERMGNDRQAIARYNTSNKIAQNSGDYNTVQMSYENLSNNYWDNGDSEQAIEVQQEAYKFNETFGNRAAQRDNARNIAVLNLDMANPDDAIPYIESTIEISEELDDYESVSEGSLLLSQAYEQKGDYQSALEEFEKYQQAKDSIDNVKAKQELLALRTKEDLRTAVGELENMRAKLNSSVARIDTLEQDLSMKDAKISRSEALILENEAARELDRIILWALVGMLFVVVIASILIYRSARQKRIANQLLALKSLRSQMNPHFIFNSLNSVNSFIAKNDERSANKYLSEFSRLMRAVMENSKHDFVPLASEVDILRLYLDLEHLRFKDKFDFVFEVEDGIDLQGITIPPMLIQPYVENAIWHGLRYKEEKGFLKLAFREEEGHIVSVIEDNGIGRKKSQELKTRNQKQNKSTGMKNIEGRLTILNQLHQTNLGVKVIDLEKGGEAVGTRVEVRIPFHQNQEDI